MLNDSSTLIVLRSNLFNKFSPEYKYKKNPYPLFKSTKSSSLIKKTLFDFKFNSFSTNFLPL